MKVRSKREENSEKLDLLGAAYDQLKKKIKEVTHEYEILNKTKKVTEVGRMRYNQQMFKKVNSPNNRQANVRLKRNNLFTAKSGWLATNW